MKFSVEREPDPDDVAVLERQIRREASSAMSLGDEEELAIFVRENGKIIAGVSGWTWGDCCELTSLWVEPASRARWLGPRLLAAAERTAVDRGCTQTMHVTYGFQAPRLYEWFGYDLVGRIEDFPTGSDARWYRKTLTR